MHRMAALRRSGLRFAYVALCLAVGLAQGCGRSDASHGSEPGASSPSTTVDQSLPFHQDPDHTSETDGSRPAVPLDAPRDNGAPFHAPARGRSLPAGTLITVQMENSLSIAHVKAGDSFTAAVAGPLTVDGDTLIGRGTPVSGRVEAAQFSVDRPGLSPDPGYVQLTLNAMAVDGKPVALQTSSLFARGTLPPSGTSKNPRPDFAGGFRVQKGRRLTFRLTAPVVLTGPNSIANRQNPNLATE
jgi:hypothetical protein